MPRRGPTGAGRTSPISEELLKQLETGPQRSPVRSQADRDLIENLYKAVMGGGSGTGPSVAGSELGYADSKLIDSFLNTRGGPATTARTLIGGLPKMGPNKAEAMAAASLLGLGEKGAAKGVGSLLRKIAPFLGFGGGGVAGGLMTLLSSYFLWTLASEGITGAGKWALGIESPEELALRKQQEQQNERLSAVKQLAADEGYAAQAARAQQGAAGEAQSAAANIAARGQFDLGQVQDVGNDLMAIQDRQAQLQQQFDLAKVFGG